MKTQSIKNYAAFALAPAAATFNALGVDFANTSFADIAMATYLGGDNIAHFAILQNVDFSADVGLCVLGGQYYLNAKTSNNGGRQ